MVDNRFAICFHRWQGFLGRVQFTSAACMLAVSWGRHYWANAKALKSDFSRIGRKSNFFIIRELMVYRSKGDHYIIQIPPKSSCLTFTSKTGPFFKSRGWPQIRYFIYDNILRPKYNSLIGGSKFYYEALWCYNASWIYNWTTWKEGMLHKLSQTLLAPQSQAFTRSLLILS